MNGRMGSCCFRICVEEGDEEESVVVVNRVEPGKMPEVRSKSTENGRKICYL